MEHGLTIKQAAAHCGVSEHTLRYYERVGLLSPIGRQENGHRLYQERDLAWISFLLKLRATGMPLAQIHHYAELLRAGAHTAGERMALLAAHQAQVESQVAELNAALEVIRHKVQHYRELGAVFEAPLLPEKQR